MIRGVRKHSFFYVANVRAYYVANVSISYYMKVDMRAYESRLLSEKRHENKISTHIQKVLTKVLTNPKSSGIVIE